MSRRLRFPARAAGAVCIVLLLGVTGCSQGMSGHHAGSSPSSSAGPQASGPHNVADVRFSQGMIPHHAQAVQMATTALRQSGNPAVRELATAIQGAQAPEIRQMSGWLVGWGVAVPSSGEHSMSGGSMDGMSGGSMEGMMTDAEMQQLAAAKGPAFDRRWLQMMTRHHQGAIVMARAEIAQGSNAESKALASKIITAQTAEIATMAALLTAR